MDGIMSMKRNKQIPLGLTEGERNTLKEFRILSCLWHSWGWKNSVVYSILVIPTRVKENLLYLIEEGILLKGVGLELEGKYSTLIHFPSALQITSCRWDHCPSCGALTELQSKQFYYLTIHQQCWNSPWLIQAVKLNEVPDH